ncbi:T9SS type A sorting domain-containing protein [Saccharicrinis sp. FJH2]|uniref:T9SS type A sorting domain-containing protein n=1 Tax=Saccharicrinis sp. FJH65 TaxID=3344659 RepID=UPI0035F3C1D6
MKSFRRVLILMLLYSVSQNAVPLGFYISLTGNDSNSGTAKSEAWFSIDKVTEYAQDQGFSEGDTVYFEGGKTFTTYSSLYLRCDKSSGSESYPLVFTSFGSDRATLKARGCHLFEIWAPNKTNIRLGIEIRDLILEGDSTTQNPTSNASGISVSNNSILDLNYLLIENVEIRGFAGNGIAITRNLDKGKFTNLIVRNVIAHHNPGNSEVSPHTGSGIMVAGADSALIEHCIAHNNGIKNNNSGGPVGIWFWDCTNSIIQYCESYENKTTSGDGGGFDLDGACQNCIIQYCYSHDNYGAGFLLAQFAGAKEYGPLANNVIRYNISENDGRKRSYCGIYVWGATTDDYVGVNYVYNNTVYMGETPLDGSPACIGFLGKNMRGVKIWNNIFMSDNNLSLINSTYSFNTDSVVFQNNAYYSGYPNDFKINWLSTYSSLSSWRNNANGQEMDGDKPLGLETNPLFVSPGNGFTVGDTYALNSLNAYKLKPESPLIDSASNLLFAPFLLSNVGENDFYGNVIPGGLKYDFGAFDTTNIKWPQIYLGDDIKACQGDAVWISANGSFDSYLWSTGEISDTIMITSSGYYVLTVSENGYFNSDTIQVTFISLPEVDLGDDLDACNQDTITLNAGNNFESYLWSDGEQTQSIRVTSTGSYKVTVSQNGCTSTDSIQVTFESLPEIELGNDITSCQGDTISLDAGNSFESYYWNTGEEYPEIQVTSTGSYWVTVGNQGCTNSDSIEVTFESLPEIELGDGISSCQGDTITLDAGDIDGFYLWSTGDETQSIKITSSGTYYVKVKQDGCTNIDSVIVTLKPLPYIDLGNDTLIKKNQTLILNAGHSFGYYEWSTGDFSESIEISGLEPGKYSYSVLVTDSNSCSNSDTIYVDVSAITNFTAIKNSGINVYPNPAHKEIWLNYTDSEGMVYIYNLSGKKVIEQNYHGVNTVIQISGLADGVYIIEFLQDKKLVRSKFDKK